MIVDVADLVQLAAADHRESNTSLTAADNALAPSSTARIGVVHTGRR
jgi:hypothetical protein